MGAGWKGSMREKKMNSAILSKIKIIFFNKGHMGAEGGKNKCWGGKGPDTFSNIERERERKRVMNIRFLFLGVN